MPARQTFLRTQPSAAANTHRAHAAAPAHHARDGLSPQAAVGLTAHHPRKDRPRIRAAAHTQIMEIAQ